MVVGGELCFVCLCALRCLPLCVAGLSFVGMNGSCLVELLVFLLWGCCLTSDVLGRLGVDSVLFMCGVVFGVWATGAL